MINVRIKWVKFKGFPRKFDIVAIWKVKDKLGSYINRIYEFEWKFGQISNVIYIFEWVGRSFRDINSKYKLKVVLLE